MSVAAWPGLRRGIVDVWSVNVAQGLAQLPVYRQQLNSDELHRAGQCRAAYKYHEFIITRGLLRQRLSEHLHLPAADIQFSTLEHGKLVLHERHGRSDIQFNVSHSQGEVLLALTLVDAVGVDIEKVRPEVCWPALAKRFFSPAEYDALQHYAGEHAVTAFFSCWTRKEAFVKAVGDGIAYGLKAFEVNVEPDSAARLLRLHTDATAARQWSLHRLEVAAGYVATLGVHSPDTIIRQWP